MKDYNRTWRAEFENGETAIIRALNKQTARLFAENMVDNDKGYEIVKLEEID